MAQWFDITAVKGQKIDTLMQAWGVTYDPNDPYASAYQAAINKARPYAGKKPYEKGGNWDLFAEMCLRARSMFFAESKVGDCGSQTASGGNLAGTVGGLALSGAQIGEGIAGVALSSALGAATAGIGLVLGPILSIFTHHAQAVAQEKKALCSVNANVSQLVENVYASLAAGSISVSDAVQYMTNISTQVANSLKPITKDCNDSCGYVAILQAHVAFISSLSPTSQSSVASPTGALSGIGAAIQNLFGGSGTGSNWLLPALVLLVLVVVLWGRNE